MAVRKKGRSIVEVGGRRFAWYVHRDTHIRIASDDKRFIVAYRWFGEPELLVVGPEFPGLDASMPRPVILHPPNFAYRSPGELVRKVVWWALFSGVHSLL